MKKRLISFCVVMAVCISLFSGISVNAAEYAVFGCRFGTNYTSKVDAEKIFDLSDGTYDTELINGGVYNSDWYKTTAWSKQSLPEEYVITINASGSHNGTYYFGYDQALQKGYYITINKFTDSDTNKKQIKLYKDGAEVKDWGTAEGSYSTGMPTVTIKREKSATGYDIVITDANGKTFEYNDAAPTKVSDGKVGVYVNGMWSTYIESIFWEYKNTTRIFSDGVSNFTGMTSEQVSALFDTTGSNRAVITSGNALVVTEDSNTFENLSVKSKEKFLNNYTINFMSYSSKNETFYCGYDFENKKGYRVVATHTGDAAEITKASLFIDNGEESANAAETVEKSFGSTQVLTFEKTKNSNGGYDIKFSGGTSTLTYTDTVNKFDGGVAGYYSSAYYSPKLYQLSWLYENDVNVESNDFSMTFAGAEKTEFDKYFTATENTVGLQTDDTTKLSGTFGKGNGNYQGGDVTYISKLYGDYEIQWKNLTNEYAQQTEVYFETDAARKNGYKLRIDPKDNTVGVGFYKISNGTATLIKQIHSKDYYTNQSSPQQSPSVTITRRDADNGLQFGINIVYWNGDVYDYAYTANDNGQDGGYTSVVNVGYANNKIGSFSVKHLDSVSYAEAKNVAMANSKVSGKIDYANYGGTSAPVVIAAVYDATGMLIGTSIPTLTAAIGTDIDFSVDVTEDDTPKTVKVFMVDGLSNLKPLSVADKVVIPQTAVAD